MWTRSPEDSALRMLAGLGVVGRGEDGDPWDPLKRFAGTVVTGRGVGSNWDPREEIPGWAGVGDVLGGAGQLLAGEDPSLARNISPAPAPQPRRSPTVGPANPSPQDPAGYPVTIPTPAAPANAPATPGPVREDYMGMDEPIPEGIQQGARKWNKFQDEMWQDPNDPNNPGGAYGPRYIYQGIDEKTGELQYYDRATGKVEVGGYDPGTKKYIEDLRTKNLLPPGSGAADRPYALQPILDPRTQKVLRYFDPNTGRTIESEGAEGMSNSWSAPQLVGGDLVTFEVDSTGRPTGRRETIEEGKPGEQKMENEWGIYAVAVDKRGNMIPDAKPRLVMTKPQKPQLVQGEDGALYGIYFDMGKDGKISMRKDVLEKPKPKLRFEGGDIYIPDELKNTTKIVYPEHARKPVGQGQDIDHLSDDRDYGDPLGLASPQTVRWSDMPSHWEWDDLQDLRPEPQIGRWNDIPDDGLGRFREPTLEDTLGPTRLASARGVGWGQEGGPPMDLMGMLGGAAGGQDPSMMGGVPQDGWTLPIAPESVEGMGNKFGDPASMEGIHKGTDIQAVEGTPILAPVDGQVVQVIYDPKGLGLKVVIQDEQGQKHTLAHMESSDVKPGDRVFAGQPVGKVGMTGAGATGPHLDIREQDPRGNYVNPERRMGAMAQMPPSPNTVGQGQDGWRRPGYVGVGQGGPNGWSFDPVEIARRRNAGAHTGYDGSNLPVAQTTTTALGGGDVQGPGGTVSMGPSEAGRQGLTWQQTQNEAAWRSRQLDNERSAIETQYNIARERLAEEARQFGLSHALKVKQQELDESYRRDMAAIQVKESALERDFKDYMERQNRQFNVDMSALNNPWARRAGLRTPRYGGSGWQPPSGGGGGWQQQSVGGQLASMPGGALTPEQWNKMSPFDATVWRANAEMSGPGAWGRVQDQTQQNFAKEGITQAPVVTPLHAAQGWEQIAKVNDTEELLGGTSEDAWKRIANTWSQAGGGAAQRA